MFNPGETIGHKFIIPILTSEIQKVIVSYKQNGHIVLELTVTSEHIEQGETVTESEFTVTFSQAQSLLFDENGDVYAQLNVILKSGTRCASREILIHTGPQHIREVISNG